jgi:hypothetical protein
MGERTARLLHRPQSREPRGPAASPFFVLGARIVLLVFAAGALSTALIVGALRDASPIDPRVRYICPMHAEVTSAVPGVCPICRMDLEPVNTSASGTPSNTVKASTYQTYDTARRRAYGPDMRAPAWVDGEGGGVTAVLYNDELASRVPEQRAVFSPSSAPGSSVEVRATAESPEPWDRSTSRVHFRADATTHLHPDEVGWLRLAVRPPEPPVIPSSAILEGPDGPYVLVASSDARTLTKRPVKIGRSFGGVAAVLSGLSSTERVLIGSAFFVDAERRLRRQTTIEITPR